MYFFFLSSRIVCFDDTHLSTAREKKVKKVIAINTLEVTKIVS